MSIACFIHDSTASLPPVPKLGAQIFDNSHHFHRANKKSYVLLNFK